MLLISLIINIFFVENGCFETTSVDKTNLNIDDNIQKSTTKIDWSSIVCYICLSIFISSLTNLEYSTDLPNSKDVLSFLASTHDFSFLYNQTLLEKNISVPVQYPLCSGFYPGGRDFVNLQLEMHSNEKISKTGLENFFYLLYNVTKPYYLCFLPPQRAMLGLSDILLHNFYVKIIESGDAEIVGSAKYILTLLNIEGISNNYGPSMVSYKTLQGLIKVAIPCWISSGLLLNCSNSVVSSYVLHNSYYNLILKNCLS
jgi:hypothetical protein